MYEQPQAMALEAMGATPSMPPSAPGRVFRGDAKP